MYFICKLESHEIEGDNGLIVHVKNAKKSDDLSEYKNKKRMYSLLNCGDDMESYRTIKVFLFEELANEELERLLAEDKEYWDGWEVMEYGQELKDTISAFINTFQFQVIAVKIKDDKGNDTGEYGMLEPCDFHTMVLRCEETKEDLKKVSENRKQEAEKKLNSLGFKIKYNLIRFIDWSFKLELDAFSAFLISMFFCAFLAIFFNFLIGTIMLAVSFVMVLVLSFVEAILFFTSKINQFLFFCFRKVFNKYYN